MADRGAGSQWALESLSKISNRYQKYIDELHKVKLEIRQKEFNAVLLLPLWKDPSRRCGDNHPLNWTFEQHPLENKISNILGKQSSPYVENPKIAIDNFSECLITFCAALSKHLLCSDCRQEERSGGSFSWADCSKIAFACLK